MEKFSFELTIATHAVEIMANKKFVSVKFIRMMLMIMTTYMCTYLFFFCCNNHQRQSVDNNKTIKMFFLVIQHITLQREMRKSIGKRSMRVIVVGL
jgi:hypothetical protein